MEQPTKISWIFEFYFPLARSKTESLTWDWFKNLKESGCVSFKGQSHIDSSHSQHQWTLVAGRVNLFDAKSKYQFFEKQKYSWTLKIKTNASFQQKPKTNKILPFFFFFQCKLWVPLTFCTLRGFIFVNEPNENFSQGFIIANRLYRNIWWGLIFGTIFRDLFLVRISCIRTESPYSVQI